MAAVAESLREPTRLPPDDRKSWGRYLKVLDIGVLLASLVVFLIFLALLIRFVFPEGQRLGDLAAGSGAMITETDEVGLVDISGGSVSNFGNFVAQLADVRRDVRIRPADSIAWSDASAGVTVRNRDAVQTFSNSRARVDFTTDNELRIGQNSLVVFRSGAADPFLERRDPAIVVMNGELTGTVNADYGALGVQFPAGLVELAATGPTKEAVDFRIGVNPDGSSTIAIYSGQADVNIAGEHYRVGANQGLTILEDGRTPGTRTLPALPVIRGPNNNAVAKFLAAPPRVEFAWNKVSNAQTYRLEIASDAGFEEILVDEYLSEPSFTHANLSAGNYFWRISARDGWVLGPTSTPRRLRVVPDSMPPSLKVRPIQLSASGQYSLRGKTTPGASILVLGQSVSTTAGGDFEFLFSPDPGAQTIVVESVDEVGNVAYSSQVLHVPGTSGRSE